MIENNSIEILKSTIDIIDVVSNYIELKKAGANFKANCPFHGEKTPSFVVSPSKQIYHCFGCGVGGDAIKFVMEIEKLTYPEAIEKVASTYNFTLQYTKGSSDYSESKRILESVQKWYVKNLDLNKEAKEYLYNRGVTNSSIEKFEIGYVGKGKDVLNFLSSNLFQLPKVEESGVIAKGETGDYYARLVDRIIFPIYSSNGSIVGFGGRTLGSHPAKYINSPQTKLFNKSRLLYGYHKAKESIYQNKKLIICEGYLDVISFHQAGFTEAVATLGTALTPEHLPLLKKGSPFIILAYDGDKAGIEAGIKASKMLSIAGFDGGIVLFPDGQDPADMIANGQSNIVAKLLRDATPLIPFILEATVQKYNLYNPREKEEAFKEIKRYLASLSPIIQDSYIPLASTYLGVSPVLFGKSVDISQAQTSFSANIDTIELKNILKTILDKPELIDYVLDVIDRSFFGNYQYMFDLIIQKDYDNPVLMGLLIDENIKIMDEVGLNKSLLWILQGYYSRVLKDIAKNNMIDFNKKSFLIRKIRNDILPRLKRGELVIFEKLF
ncbi:DNA primase [hydrothermal vent metagenome]|uniref:DNA primase n=1 Tax=hydrothermal vent metagenome TaxID=652676 RepID=A0A1W1CES2_9ZZZZ